METFNERLAKARTDKRLSKTGLGKLVGVSQPTVSDWESGLMQPNGKNLLALCRALGVTPEWLTSGRDTPLALQNPGEPGPDFIPVARVLLKVSAGVTGFRVEHLDGNGPPIFFRADWLASHGYRADRLFALRVTGDSMEPNLWDGDLVVINTADNAPADGVVFVANYEGEAVIKRLERNAGEWWLAEVMLDILGEVMLDILGADTDVAPKDTESYFALLYQGKTNRWLLRYYAEGKHPRIQVIVPMTDDRKREVARAGLQMGPGDSILLPQPDSLMRLPGIVFDALEYCRNDENFKRKNSEA